MPVHTDGEKLSISSPVSCTFEIVTVADSMFTSSGSAMAMLPSMAMAPPPSVKLVTPADGVTTGASFVAETLIVVVAVFESSSPSLTTTSTRRSTAVIARCFDGSFEALLYSI